MSAPLQINVPFLQSVLAGTEFATPTTTTTTEPVEVAPSPASAPQPTTLAGAGGGRTFFRGQQFKRSFPRFATGARLQPQTLLGGRLVDPTFPRNDLLNMLLLLRFGDR